jgi:hypothetical protein
MTSNPRSKVTLSLSLPPSFRAAIYAESNRTGSTPSRVVEAVLVRYLPTFVSEEIASDLGRQHISESRGEES